MQSRRQFNRTMLAGIPAVLALGSRTFCWSRVPGAPNSRWSGVQIWAISYSFRALPADQILPAMVKVGLSEVELMSNHVEELLGAPNVKPSLGGIPNAEGQAALAKWRATISTARFQQLRKTFDNAGVEIRILCYNLPKGCDDDEIEYSFQMAKALGARAISSTAQISTARRVGPFADKHKIMWGGHVHDRVEDPEEFATP